MAIEFKFPDVGEGITEGEIVKWKVKEGDSVKEGDVLAEVETDKAVVEIPSPRTGKILKLNGKEGERVRVGQVIVLFEGEGIPSAPAPKPTAAAPAGPAPPWVARTAPAGKGVLASPATRQLAKQLGVEIEKVSGTGEGGRVSDEDVKRAYGGAAPVLAKPASSGVKVALKYDFYGHLERVPLKGMRGAIARHMVEAKAHAPHATGMDEADVTALWKLREKEKKEAEKQGIHLTFLSYIIKAIVKSLAEHPYLNASVDEEANEILLKQYYSIGIAVDTPDGLMVPVVKHCDEKPILEIAQEITLLSEAARTRKIDLADLKGGTFSITNFGSVAGTYAVPIINYPEVAILGVGRISDMPRVVGKKVAIRKILPLSLTFDHRVVDGAEGARFLTKVKQYLENPELFMTEGKT